METNEAKQGHTPGPWSATEENCAGGLNIMDSTGHYIAHTEERHISGKHVTTETAKANAALMAAAPDLLAALDDLRKELRAHVKFDVKKHYSLMLSDVAADKAIKRARGEAC